MPDLETCIQRHWTHSHEEDTRDVRVYRPDDYDFPPARGRVGFEFQEGGELIYYGIAAADGTELSTGRWTLEDSNLIQIEVDNDRIEPFTLEVVSCDEDMLTVKR